ncbi:MAG: PEGA domain-containing protein [Patescibacteria group bacterium]
MTHLSKYRVFFTLGITGIVLLVALGAIFYARGFKPNLKKGTIDRTGLIVATSTPTGANVFLDGRLTSATNTNIAYLEPRTYKVRIEKDGYTTWEKDVDIKEDLATEINALLFPLAPEIKPLTTTGSTNPTLSLDGAKIVYAVPGERGGLYLLPMDNSPFPFRQNTKLLAKNTPGTDYSKSRFIWNPDSKELIARFEDENGTASANLLVDSEKSDQSAKDVTGSLAATLTSWQQILDERAKTSAILAPDSVKDATTSAQIASTKPSPTPKSVKQSPTTQNTKKTVNREPSTVNLINYSPSGLMFSPDEEKILYKNGEGKNKVYDLKLKKDYTLPDLTDLINISWFPDSKHLVIAQKDLISIIETDGNNKMTIYTGKFVNGFVFAHPSGSRLIILTTLTQAENSLPNLYSINLK